jgi:hypothetical protein
MRSRRLSRTSFNRSNSRVAGSLRRLRLRPPQFLLGVSPGHKTVLRGQFSLDTCPEFLNRIFNDIDDSICFLNFRFGEN